MPTIGAIVLAKKPVIYPISKTEKPKQQTTAYTRRAKTAGRPPYRSEMSSAVVMIRIRRHSGAQIIATSGIQIIQAAHQSQLAARPYANSSIRKAPLLDW